MIEFLRGVRIIESGPLYNSACLGMLLGDLGADVIKIESPSGGRFIRNLNGNILPDLSIAHIQLNRNKRSLAVDLRRPAGREVFWRLLDTADAFVDGNKYRACDRLGIGYEAQRARKPDIIYCHHTGFGVSGPYATIPTQGTSMNGLAGVYRSYLGADGLVRQRSSSGVWGGTDRGGDAPVEGAIFGALFLAAALVQRTTTGRGSFIDVAGADARIASGWIAVAFGLNDHRVTDRRAIPLSESGEMTSAKLTNYQTRDGKYIHFACIVHAFWDRFCREVHREDLIARKDVSVPADYALGDVELRLELQAIFHERTLSEWVSMGRELEIPISPAYSELIELTQDEHLRQREILVAGVHPQAGEFTYVGVPAMIPGQPFEVVRPAPALGEHSAPLLRELGYDDASIEELRATETVCWDDDDGVYGCGGRR